MENAEDEFANTVEDAINIMQNVLKMLNLWKNSWN